MPRPTGCSRLLEPVRLSARRRALVTILEEEPAEEADLAPERTVAQMAADHCARVEKMAPGDAEYRSIDLPFVDDGADW